MMNSAVKNIIVRVVKKRITAGEKFEDILNSYPKLTPKEIQEIKVEIEEG